MDTAALEADLRAALEGEVRFDAVSRALYSTDASVYQMLPAGVVVALSKDDIRRAVAVARKHGCPITMRGGGTSQAGQAIGEGLQIDVSKYCSRVLEVNPEERWARVEPGIVLDELNAKLKEHGLRFAPDISTASRATIGGMIANNSSGARSVLYGKTIDHVLELHVLFADGSEAWLRPIEGAELEAESARQDLAGAAYRAVRRLGPELAEEIDRRYPKVLRRVQGYNLDDFTDPAKPVNLARLIVGSEGTLGVVLEAKLKLVPLPRHKSVVVIEFNELLEALGATPAILEHKPSAVEVMDKFILDHTRQNPALDRQKKTFVTGDPGAILCVEFYADRAEELPPRMQALEADLRARGVGDAFFHATEAAAQARVWGLREAALGLSMAMKDDNKSWSFVEDTAVAPERLRDYIARFLEILRGHGTASGIYAHASVGCLHVRPVVNMKTSEGLAKFEAIANAVSDLVLEFGGSLSGEHGDGMVRGPFLEKMFGPAIYGAFREIKRAVDPEGILNPGKIVDCPPLLGRLRYGTGYKAANPFTVFDYSAYGGMAGAVEMCSGLGVCRKKLDGTMCPSYMATKEEQHSTRGRANVLRLALSGELGEASLAHEGVKDALDLCLECRACRTECPVGVDVGRFKSEFLHAWHGEHGVSLKARVVGNAHMLAKAGSALAPLSNWVANAGPVRWMNEQLLGLDARRPVPEWQRRTLRDRVRDDANPDVLLFVDTFTNHNHPHVGEAAVKVLRVAGKRVALAANVCCGRPLISQGLLDEAKALAARNARLLGGELPLVMLEPSCLSSVAEDAQDLLRDEEQEAARAVGRRAVLFEEYAAGLGLKLRPGPKRILLHGHCHQKSMGRLAAAKELLGRIPGAEVVDLDAGCCGMAGSFGYAKDKYDVSRAIAGRKLLPAARSMGEGDVLLAAGTSCRHQVADFAGVSARHPAELLAELAE
jgi:FAD/FMN-containing dehydrogenase/Fe-S oxidoreductase